MPVEKNSIISKPYRTYRHKIYPQIRDLRGATRIAETLEKISFKGLEKIDEEKSTDFSDLDWQNLVVLDGCRYDLFKELHALPGPYRYSSGSSSAGCIEENFSSGEWDDTVLITGNPHFHNSHFKRITGRSVESVFHTVFHVYEEGWNEEKGTVPPDEVVSRVRTAVKLFPQKRKLIWFMQPHHPFIGSDELGEGEGFTQFLDEGQDFADTRNVWSLGERGEISKARLWKAYCDNLEYVQSYVEEVVELVTGRTLLTSDHGNLVGENQRYGHPRDRRERVLRKVPVKVLQNG